MKDEVIKDQCTSQFQLQDNGEVEWVCRSASGRHSMSVYGKVFILGDPGMRDFYEVACLYTCVMFWPE